MVHILYVIIKKRRRRNEGVMNDKKRRNERYSLSFIPSLYQGMLAFLHEK
jgi:hypothetical protein